MNNNKINFVKELTKFRLNNYPLEKDSFLFQPPHLDELMSIMIEISEKTILSSSKNALEAGKQCELAKKNITQLASQSPVLFIFFSAQLVHYFTIICDVELSAKINFAGKLNFLESKQELYGDISNNIFLLDYFIPVIYNEIFRCEDSLEKMSPPEKLYKKKWLGHDEKKMELFIDSVLTTLNALKVKFPSLLIIDYLLVMYNYTRALLNEYFFKLHDEEYAEKAPTIPAEQELHYINQVKDCFLKLEKNLAVSTVDPFFLGQTLLEKFPAKSIAEFKNHLDSLGILSL